MSIWAALEPIWDKGLRTVLRGTGKSLAMVMSLKPTRATSDPTVHPRSLSAPIAPIAVVSLTAKIAVGGASLRMSLSAAPRPPSASKVEGTKRSRGVGIPRSASASTHPLDRSRPVLA